MEKARAVWILKCFWWQRRNDRTVKENIRMQTIGPECQMTHLAQSQENTNKSGGKWNGRALISAIDTFSLQKAVVQWSMRQRWIWWVVVNHIAFPLKKKRSIQKAKSRISIHLEMPPTVFSKINRARVLLSIPSRNSNMLIWVIWIKKRQWTQRGRNKLKNAEKWCE